MPTQKQTHLTNPQQTQLNRAFMKSQCELIVALDLPSREASLKLLKQLGPSALWVKIGLQLFTRYGPSIVKEISALGYKIFLDLKLHDIPNTVASAIKSLGNLPIDMLTLHASGGEEMLRQASLAQQEALPNARLLGVTVLTSLNQSALNSLGIDTSPERQVLRLAQLCQNAKIHGIVCSPLEISCLKETYGNSIKLVTPGIRPKGICSDEQKRITTPEDAAEKGASYIVVGRPITQAKDPQAVAQSIQQSLTSSVLA